MKQRTKRHRHGASIIELLLVMAIIGILTRLITFNLFKGYQQTSLATSRVTLVSDLRRQQIRAMHGDTNTPGTYLDYSVRFEQHRYILFPGIVYDEQNPENEPVDLNATEEFRSIDLPFSVITFARLSGDIRDYDPIHKSMLLTNTQTGDQYEVTFNEHGIPFSEKYE